MNANLHRTSEITSRLNSSDSDLLKSSGGIAEKFCTAVEADNNFYFSTRTVLPNKISWSHPLHSSMKAVKEKNYCYYSILKRITWYLIFSFPIPATIDAVRNIEKNIEVLFI
jgi:hypothetical protein